MVSDNLPLNSYFLRHASTQGNTNFIDSLGSLVSLFDFSIKHSFTDALTLKSDDHSIKLVVLGHFYDPFERVAGEPVAKKLLADFQTSSTSFYERLDRLSGRFVIFIGKHNGALHIFPDACSTIPVAYHVRDDSLVVSSHPYLIQSFYDLNDDNLLRELTKAGFYKLGIRHFPADKTEVQGVKVLTPNLVLSYVDKSINIDRVFPRQPRRELTVEEVVESVSSALKGSIQCLLSYRKDTRCALSGGVDSRISLAASEGCRDKISFFTFSGKGNANRDLQSTKKLANKLGLKFNEINLLLNSDETCLDKVYRNMQGATRYPNAHETAARRRHFGKTDSFEIRSSVSEVSRSFFKRKFRVKTPSLSSAAMVPLYKRVPFNKKWHQCLSEVFSEWIEVSKFDVVAEQGYDWLDLLYWELRVGTWQALVLQDADYYTNPTVLFNNRKLLEIMLSSPDGYREKDDLQLMIMERLDPNVLCVDIVKNFGGAARLREVVESLYLRMYLTCFKA